MEIHKRSISNHDNHRRLRPVLPAKFAAAASLRKYRGFGGARILVIRFRFMPGIRKVDPVLFKKQNIKITYHENTN